MKKWVKIGLTVMTVGLLSACGNGTEKTSRAIEKAEHTNTVESGAKESEEKEPVTILVAAAASLEIFL